MADVNSRQADEIEEAVAEITENLQPEMPSITRLFLRPIRSHRQARKVPSLSA